MSFYIRMTVTALVFISITSCGNTMMAKEQNSNEKGVDLPFETLYSDLNCGRNDKASAITWMTKKEQLQKFFEMVNKRIINRTITPPNLDFTKYGALLIEMGMRRTAGYGMNIGPKPIHISDGTVDVTVLWKEPTQGTILQQVITSPCLLIKLPMKNYTQFNVRDQDGKLRIEKALQ